MKLIPTPRWIEKAAPRLPRWGLLIGLFLMIAGAKLWLVDRFGNVSPNGDEWAACAKIINSYLSGTLNFMQFFAPHNEHRVAWTRLLCLGSYLANRQWDPYQLIILDVVIQTLAILTFVYGAARSMSAPVRFAFAVFAGVVSMLPFGWQNTLWSFQSCFYCMMLFGMLCIWLCWRYEAFSGLWWLGAACGFSSLFTVAGGAFSVIAIAGFLTLRVMVERGPRWKRDLAGACVLWAIAAFGVLITPQQEPHEHLIATSFGAFCWALSGILFWPCITRWACLIIQGPLIALAVLCVVRRVSFRDGRWFVIVAAGSYWIQALVTAYRRCGDWDARRYYDSWSMLLIILCACLCLVWQSVGERRRFWVYVFAGIWIGACVYGCAYRMVNVTPRQIMEEWDARMDMENNVRQYLSTGDAKWLGRLIPYRDADVLKQELDFMKPRGVLPPNLVNPNPPLVAANREREGDSFVANGVPPEVPALDKPVIGSFTNGAKARGTITLGFNVPPGTLEVELQVAGYPNARGNVLAVEEPGRDDEDIVPVDPGDYWKTVFLQLHHNTSHFEIIATDESERAWVAFSMPSVVRESWIARLAKVAGAEGALVFEVGLALLVVCGIATIKETPSDEVGRRS